MAYHFGSAARAPRIFQRPFELMRDGRTYNASYEIEGDEVIVCCAYGSDRAAAAPSPRVAAERLLNYILDRRMRWCSRRPGTSEK